MFFGFFCAKNYGVFDSLRFFIFFYFFCECKKEKQSELTPPSVNASQGTPVLFVGRLNVLPTLRIGINLTFKSSWQLQSQQLCSVLQ